MILRDYQQRCVDANLERFNAGPEPTLNVAATGCHAAGQGILMADGTIRDVEDVRPRDRLIGPDGKPRLVGRTVSSDGALVRIVPVKGRPFVVNLNHILTLVRTGKGSGKVIDVSVRDWLAWSGTRKHLYKLFRAEVKAFDYDGHRPLDPYFLGVILGDGSVYGSVRVSTPDPEIVEELRSQAKRRGMECRNVELRDGKCPQYTITGDRTGRRGSLLIRDLKQVGVWNRRAGDKHIPHAYRTAPWNDRRELLAGLLDTDGHLNRTPGYDFISKSPRLADGVAFVCRSLGLAAYVKQCEKGCQTGAVGTYYRVSISGDLRMIPCRVARKRVTSPRRQRKNVLRTGFSVESVGRGKYYGFSLDSDGRYLLDDFTVTHNTGKTVTFCEIAKSMREHGKVMVLCHERELVEQAEAKLRAVTMDAVGVEQGPRTAAGGLFSPDIVVASVPSLVSGTGDYRRMQKFNPRDFSAIIPDECHFAVTNTWGSVIDYFRGGNPDLRMAGFTATPDRRDEKSIMGAFPDLAFQYDYLDALNDGWLVKPRWAHVPIYDAQTLAVRSGGKDFTESDCSDLVNEINQIAATVKKTIELREDRKTLFFCVDIEHATRVTEVFANIRDSNAGFAAMVTGKTPLEQRQSTISAFRAGDIQTLVVVGIGNYGFDVPDIGCIVLGRPSASRPRVSQNIGRGTRVLPGIVDGLATPEERREAIAASAKPDIIILDFCFNSPDLVTPAAALLPAESAQVLELAARRARESDEAIDVLQAAAEANKELAEAVRIRRLGEGVRLDVTAVHEWMPVDPFAGLGLTPKEVPLWSKGKKPTRKMADVLTRHGVVNPEKLPWVHAKQLIDECMKIPSVKQVKWIKRCRLDPRSVSRSQANWLMSQLATGVTYRGRKMPRWMIPRGWVPNLPADEPANESEVPF